MNNDIVIDRIVNLLRGRRLNYKEYYKIRMELELCVDLPSKYKENYLKEDFLYFFYSLNYSSNYRRNKEKNIKEDFLSEKEMEL